MADIAKAERHPEQLVDELFIANSNDTDFKHIGWKTKRAGTTAYDAGGRVIPGQIPVFAKRKEIEEDAPDVLKLLEKRQGECAPAKA